MGNNPVMMVDPDGELAWFVPILVGAALNTAFNANKIDNFWDGLGYFAVGAASGALGAGLGTGISAALGGSSFGAGFAAAFSGTGTLAGAGISGATSGFLSGAAIGGGVGFGAGFLSGTGNALVGGSNFGDALGTGLRNGAIGGLSGAALGGLVAGIDAASNDANFWTGKVNERGGGNFGSKGRFLNEEVPGGAKPTKTGEIATTPQNCEYGCYGNTRNGGKRPHFGVDYKGEVGDDVYAMYDGDVIRVGHKGSYGPHTVRTSSMINGKNYYVDYGHLSKSAVTVGQNVNAGNLIGYMGRHGIPSIYPTHVHIAIWRPLPGGLMGFVQPWWR